MKIIEAEISDALALTELTIRSKSYWNYSKEQISEWNEDLKVTEDYINNNRVYKLMIETTIVGYYSYIIKTSDICYLDNVFIDPSFIRLGYGKLLMHDFIEKVKAMQYSKITLDSDPHAQQFYEKLGFVVVGKLETSVPNRHLPIMELKIC